MTVSLEILMPDGECINIGSRLYEELLLDESDIYTKRVSGILSSKERAVLTPTYIDTEITHDVMQYSGVDPDEFTSALSKVYEDLKANEDLYPKEYSMNGELRSAAFSSKGRRCYLEGFSGTLDYPSHVLLVCTGSNGLTSSPIEVSDHQRSLKVDDQFFVLEQRTAYERYKRDIDSMFRICVNAAQLGSQVFWYIAY